MGEFAGAWAAMALLVAAPVVALLLRRQWRRAAARQEEVRRLVERAAAEAEFAEREMWKEFEVGKKGWGGYGDDGGRSAPDAAARPAPARVSLAAAVEAAMKGLCAVCGTPTNRRCSKCKAVKYCSRECQTSHWMLGHKDECCPPMVIDDKFNGKVEVSVPDKEKEEYGSSNDNHNTEGVRVKNGRKLSPTILVSNEPKDDLTGKSSSVQKPSYNGTQREAQKPHGKKNAKDESAENLSSPDVPSSFHDGAVNIHSAPIVGGRFPNLADNETTGDHFHGDTYVKQDPQLLRPNTLLRRSNSPGEIGSPENFKTEPLHNDNIKGSTVQSSASSGNKLKLRSNVTDTLKNHDSYNGSFIQSSSNLDEETNPPAKLLKKVTQPTPPKVARQYPSEWLLFSYDTFVKLYNSDKVDLHPFGLTNLGNSCYANAVLQCLIFTRPLNAYLLGRYHSKNCHIKGWCFTCEFERLIVKGKEKKSSLSPIEIISHLKDIASGFGIGKQEDAHEFLRFVIDTMQLESSEEARLAGRSNQAIAETTFVQMLFGGYLQSRIKCSGCKIRSLHRERFLDLTVDIEADASLEGALKRFTNPETLDKENKYRCERCKSFMKARKTLSILEAPNILTITLKRYQPGAYGKNNKLVSFPATLDLASYMSGVDDKSPVYSLYGVVVHQSETNATIYGHYVCYVKDAKGKWFEINDDKVDRVAEEIVLSQCAYMLLYARCSPRAPSSVRNPNHPMNAQSSVHNVPGGSVSSSCRSDMQMPPYTPISQPDLDQADHHADLYSPSDCSSLISNSDESTNSSSTDGTRYSISTDEYDPKLGSQILYHHPAHGTRPPILDIPEASWDRMVLPEESSVSGSGWSNSPATGMPPSQNWRSKSRRNSEPRSDHGSVFSSADSSGGSTQWQSSSESDWYAGIDRREGKRGGGQQLRRTLTREQQFRVQPR